MQDSRVKVCFVAITRGPQRRQQRVARGVRRLGQFLRDAASARQTTSTQPVSHQHLRKAAASHSARTTWLDARMQPGFCAYHLMHAGVTAAKRRALCGAAPSATLANQGGSENRTPGSGSEGSWLNKLPSMVFGRLVLGKWWMRAAAYVGVTSDAVGDSWDNLWDSLEWLRGILEAGLEILLGPPAAEWLEGWFGTSSTSWKGVFLLNESVRIGSFVFVEC